MTPQTETPKVPVLHPNNSPPNLKTLSDYYAHYYQVVFNKLNKKDQDELKAALLKPDRIVRGEVSEYSNVRTFIKAVILLAEEQFDKAQEKNGTHRTRAWPLGESGSATGS